MGGVARLSPRHDELAVAVELHHARVDVAVADEERAVRQPRHVGRPREVGGVVARLHRRAERHHQLLAVAGELVDRVRAVVHQPDVPFRIVRVHQDAMRPHEQLVVLLPRLDQLAVAIDDVEDVIPARMARWVLLRHVVAGRVAGRDEAVGGAAFLLDHRQAAAAEDVDAIGAFGPDAGRRADDMAGAAIVLRPARHEIVRTGFVAAAFRLVHLGDRR